MGYSLPYWRWFAGGIGTGMVRFVLPLFVPWYLKYVIDDVCKPYVDGAITHVEAWWRMGWITLLMGG